MKLTPHNEHKIIYIEGDGNYSMIYMIGRPPMLISHTLKYISGKLTDSFIRIHKSYLINKKFIKSVDYLNKSVIMEGGKEIKASRAQWPVVKNILSGKPDPVNFDSLNGLMHYFGYKYRSSNQSLWEFEHKTHGTKCFIRKMNGDPFIANIEFFKNGYDRSKVKTWQGLFTAIRTHTKSEIYRREVLLQNKKAA